MRSVFHGGDGAAHAGVHVAADERRGFSDLLADLYIVAGLNCRICRGSGVHRQGNDNRVGLREPDECLVLAKLLALGGMHAAVIAV